MVALVAIVAILFVHWVSDFVFQPHWMGMRKSKETWVLLQHGSRIALGSTLVAFFLIPPVFALIFGLVNGICHIFIDAVTSRMTGKLYAKGDMHNFFVVIGFDQFIHLAFAFSVLVWITSDFWSVRF